MHVLRIEHPVKSFEDWKRAFESDPVGRQKSGVLSYRIMRPVDDPNYVMIDLEFDSAAGAEALLANLRVVWGNVQGRIIESPRARIVNVVEIKDIQKRA